MTTSRHKALGLALMAVLGLMAIGAPGAQAEQGIFLLDGKSASGSAITAAFESESGNIFHSTVGANEVKVLLSCKTLTVSEGKFLNEKEASGVVNFTKCNVEAPTGCTVAEPIVAKAFWLVYIHVKIGSVVDIIFHTGKTGEAFTTLKFSGCILPETVEVKGMPVFRDCQNALLTAQQTHLLEEVPGGLGLEPGEGLKFGAKPASTLGSSLWSVPAGKTWSVH